MSARTRITVSDILRIEMSDDGTRVTFRLLDDRGDEVCVVLPVCRLGELVAAIPNELSPTHPGNQSAQAVHPVCSWSIGAGSGSRELALTLVTDEGRVARFAMTVGQIAGIATVTQYGRPDAPSRRLLN
jgi:hypothetical protein